MYETVISLIRQSLFISVQLNTHLPLHLTNTALSWPRTAGGRTSADLMATLAYSIADAEALAKRVRTGSSAKPEPLRFGAEAELI